MGHYFTLCLRYDRTVLLSILTSNADTLHWPQWLSICQTMGPSSLQMAVDRQRIILLSHGLSADKLSDLHFLPLPTSYLGPDVSGVSRIRCHRVVLMVSLNPHLA